jgi:hypothetical protein
MMRTAMVGKPFRETSTTEDDEGIARSATPAVDIARLLVDVFAAMARVMTSRQSSGSCGID